MKKVRGLGITGVSDRQTGRGGTAGICECVCTCEPRGHCAYACTSDILSLPAEEEEGDLPVYAYVLFESYMYVLLKAAPCLWQSDWPRQCPLCVHVSGTFARLRYWLNLQLRKQ